MIFRRPGDDRSPDERSDIRDKRPRISRSLSSGAHSRDPLAHASYKHTFSFSRQAFARGFQFVCSLLKQRAQGRPGARCTRGLVCIDAQEMRTRAYRFSGNTPAFPAQWLYDLYVLSLVTGLVCHHRSREASASQELDASVGASGPHDFAVRIGAARLATQTRPPRPAPTSVTLANAPLSERDRRNKPMIWVSRKQQYFFNHGWTTKPNH